jgi:hypothetical protein
MIIPEDAIMKLTVQISARHDAATATGWVNGRSLTVDRTRAAGRAGEGPNHNELLCLALAAGYTDELLEEAERRSIVVERARVTVEAETGHGGRTTRNLALAVRLETDEHEPAVMELIEHTDRVSEVLKVIRLGTPVRLADVQLLAKRP